MNNEFKQLEFQMWSNETSIIRTIIFSRKENEACNVYEQTWGRIYGIVGDVGFFISSIYNEPAEDE